MLVLCMETVTVLLALFCEEDPLFIILVSINKGSSSPTDYKFFLASPQ